MKTVKFTLEPGLLRAQLIAVLTASMLLIVSMFGLATLAAFDRAIAPELENRTRLIGSILRSEIQRTLDLGIPLEALGGLDVYIDETIKDFPEIRRIAIVRGASNIIAEVTRTETPSLLQRSGLAQIAGVEGTKFGFPILIRNEPVGEIQVEGSPQFVETRLREVYLDVSVLAIVALLLGVELALAVAAASVWKPYGRVHRLLAEQVGGQFAHTIRATGVPVIRRVATRLNEQAEDLSRRLATISLDVRASLAGKLSAIPSAVKLERMRYSDFHDIRLALFLFATGTEISASFLPIYAREATRPDWLSAELSAAAPIGLYLIAVALMAPFGGAIVSRFGARSVFAVSTIPAALSLVAMGLTESLAIIAASRGIIGIFYAMATIACQDYAIRAGNAEEASHSSSAFVSMIFGGVFCGSVLGGVIGGKFGFSVALLVGAMLALMAGGIGARAMSGRAGDPTGLSPERSASESTTARDRGLAFWALVVAVAIPTSATTAIFIWYLAPLGLAGMGYQPGDVARVIMLYYLASALIGPLAKGLGRGKAGAMLPVFVGTVVAGVSLVYFRSTGDMQSFILAVSGCGIGHALIRAPMTALAVSLSGGSRSKLSGLRFGERVGALAGLLASAFLLSSSEPVGTLAALGTLTLAGGFAFAIMFAVSRNREGDGT